MNILGIVGTNANFSYNRFLLAQMKRQFAEQATFTLAEIDQIPLFSEDAIVNPPKNVLELCQKIKAADGVVFAVAEYDHAITAALKSMLEWVSAVEFPLKHKPVMIVGAALGSLGTVRAQENLRCILNSPGIYAKVMGGEEFLLSFAEKKFTTAGQLIDPSTVYFLAHCFENFMHFINQDSATEEESEEHELLVVDSVSSASKRERFLYSAWWQPHI